MKRCPKGTRKNKQGECVSKPAVAAIAKSESLSDEGVLYNVVYYLDTKVQIKDYLLTSSSVLYTNSHKFTDKEILATYKILHLANTFKMSMSHQESGKIARLVIEYENGKRPSVQEAEIKRMKSHIVRTLNTAAEEDAKVANIDDSAAELMIWLLQ
jgi:hypothetical protein